MKYSISFFFLIVALSIGCASPGSRGEESGGAFQKPNIIFVLADQWRAEAVGYAGNPDVITPNMDGLAQQSAVFHTAVATMSVCTPYRASLMTGQYPLTHGIFYNDKALPRDKLTMAKIYKKAGYQTGYIGKWHLNGHKEGEDPFSGRDKAVPKERRHGFDYWKVREVTHNYNNSFYFDEKDEKQFWEGYDAFPQTDSAISYIKQNRDNPFLLFLSWGPPHNPYSTAPQEFRDLYDPRTIQLRNNIPEALQDSARQVIADYYAHCTALDKAMGDLLETVESEGLAENTIIIFTSDHGDMLFSKGLLRKQKPWDESVLVPLLIRYPAQMGKMAQQINQPIGTPDILPTLLGLSHIEIPDGMEGTDFSKALIGEEPFRNEGVLITLPVPFHEWNFQNGGREYRGLRTERYTYARDLNGPWLLYDNQEDPYQDTNLIGNELYGQVEKELEFLLSQKLEETRDEFLPADDYMKKWNYLYDRTDSIRPESYYSFR